MKNLHVFDTLASCESFMSSSDFVMPFVGYIKDGGAVKYRKVIPIEPPAPIDYL